jgi:hypothetical protein
MAASWGAYVFISNLIPMYVLALIATRRCVPVAVHKGGGVIFFWEGEGRR